MKKISFVVIMLFLPFLIISMSCENVDDSEKDKYEEPENLDARLYATDPTPFEFCFFEGHKWNQSNQFRKLTSKDIKRICKRLGEKYSSKLTDEEFLGKLFWFISICISENDEGKLTQRALYRTVTDVYRNDPLRCDNEGLVN